ncbi:MULTISPECIES: anti-sigma factor family protein [Streptomyces]|uniref:anti-sigma factor family protein n=1 Tax=Streptomyces TaxID=1883 RepID=UPI000F73F0BB|nr:anti-sigma factor [Streptomyces sp. WAC05292]RSS94051.1 zf-HC2 domain-containing protein [Streptomyces sp. WAC05292]
MTPAAGTIRHPDVSEISDLAEGLLSPARTAQVRRHLAECPLCADVLASLEEIRSLLGTLPGPPRMPGDVAGRIDAALAAEALLDSTTPRNGDDAAGAAAGGAAQPTASGAAAGTPSRLGGRRPAGHPDGAAGPGRRRARRRIAVAAGLAGAAACAFGILFAGGLFGSGSPDTAARTSDPRTTAQAPAGGAYTAQGLQDSVRRLLGPADGAKKATPPEGNSTFGAENAPQSQDIDPGDRSVGTDAAGVPACVLGATGRTEAPLAAERGSYQGTEAFLLVLPHPGDTGRVDAYVVGAGCTATPSGGAGEPLLTRTYPRS